MARGINKVILIGTLGADPEVRYNPEGKCLAVLSLATNESWKDKNTGQQQERTEWHRVVIYGKLAEVAGEYLRKGSQVYFEGKLRTRKWQDQQTGQDKYTTEVVIDINGQMQMLGGPRDQNSAPGGYTQAQPQQQQSQPQQNQGYQNQQAQGQGTPKRQNAPTPPQQAPAPSMDFDDDIPFNSAPA